MRAILLVTFLSVAWHCAVFAGETAAARTEFKRSSSNSYIFLPESYLTTTGPAPLRFAAITVDCSDRSAPELIGAAKAPAKSADTIPSAIDPGVRSAIAPAPTHLTVETSAPSRDDANFARIPDEVLDFFKETGGRPVRRNYLFDAIFKPALPASAPKSSASYEQK